MPLEWVNYPPTVSVTDLSDYDYLTQTLAAIQERFDLIANFLPAHKWPAGSTPYDGGTVTDATDGSSWTITDDTDDPPDHPAKTWGSDSKPFTTGSDDYAPTSYDVIFYVNENDARYILRAHITGNTANTLTFDEPDWVRLKIIDDVTDLLDCRYSIVDHRWVGSWGERWPEYPAREHELGTASKVYVVTVTAGDTFTLTAGSTTADIDIAATADEVKQALTDIDVASFVTGDDGGPYTIAFATDVTLTADGADVDDDPGFIFDVSQKWAVNYWTTAQPTLAGSPTEFDVAFLDGDGKWQRVSITASGTNFLQFAETTLDVPFGTPYYVLNANDWWIPARRTTYDKFTWVDGAITQSSSNAGWLPYEWYRGILATYIHHNFLDTLGTWNVAEYQITRSVGEVEGFCADDTQDVLDNSVVNSDQDVCSGESRRVWAPDLYKTLRGWQLGAEELLVAPWVERKEYQFQGAIPTLNAATWFNLFAASGNCVTTTITDVDGGHNAVIDDIDLPTETPLAGEYTELNCVWAMIEDNGDVLHFSGKPSDNSVTTTLLSTPYNFVSESDNPDVNDVGKTVVIVFGGPDSAGWSRYHERWIQRLFGVTYFEPSLGDGGASAVYPPTEDDPGEWVTIPPSSQYCTSNEFGVVRDNRAVIAGESARLIGTAAPSTDYKETNPLAPYENKAWVGRPGDTGWFVPTIKGVATSGGNWFLKDDTATFWEDVGTPHSGSTSTGTDNTHVTCSSFSTNGFFAAGVRDWIGFTLDITSGVNAGETRLITGFNDTTFTFTLAPALPNAVASATSFTIREPGYIKNYYKDHRVAITVDGTTHTETCIGNDDKSLFFSTLGYTITAGATYVIDDPPVDTVWQYKPSADAIKKYNGWVRPEDATADTRGHAWRVGPRGQIENCPTIVNAPPGRMRFGDIPTHGANVLTELYNGINKLVWLKNPMGWSTQGECCWGWTAGDSGRASEASNRANFLTAFATMEAIATGQWQPIADGGEGEFTVASDSSLPPMYNTTAYTNRGGTFSGDDDPFEFGLDIGNTHRAYGHTTVLLTCLPSKTDFWAVAKCFGGTDEQAYAPCNDPPDSSLVREFNDYGSGLVYNKFKRFGTLDSSTTAERYTDDMFGPDPVNIDPEWTRPHDPTTEAGCGGSDQTNFTLNGFEVVDQVAILKFNIDGGLKYTDTTD